MNEAARLALECGVVGAGGAGFPTHVKLQSRADTLLVNAAECEPLLYKDQTILEHFAEPLLKGTLMAADAVGAGRIAVGIKEKHEGLLQKLRDEFPPEVEVVPLVDAYPSGDEFILVHEMTGRNIPKGGTTAHRGAALDNLETLYNLGLGRPVTEKFVSVSGEVPDTMTLKVPIGITLREVLEAAGAPSTGKGFVVGGPMMGHLCTDVAVPVTKLTAGFQNLQSVGRKCVIYL